MKKERDKRIGARVELDPGTDLWMRGARFGTITDVKGDIFHVRMDHPQVKRIQRFTADRLRFAAHGAEYGLLPLRADSFPRRSIRGDELVPQAAPATQQRRISTMSGYAYEYTGKKSPGPMRAKDDDWEIGVIDAMPGQLVGRRKIDGTDHYVIRVDAGGKPKYYAQTCASLK